MEHLRYFSIIAWIQSQNGRAVATKEILQWTNHSRQHVHRIINQLMDGGYIRRVKRGKYSLNDADFVLAIGLAILTPMDIYEHQSRFQLERFKESA